MATAHVSASSCPDRYTCSRGRWLCIPPPVTTPPRIGWLRFLLSPAATVAVVRGGGDGGGGGGGRGGAAVSKGIVMDESNPAPPAAAPAIPTEDDGSEVGVERV